MPKHPPSVITTDQALNEQQLLFVKAYAQGMSASAASRAAGYSNSDTGHELLKRPHIQAALVAEQKEYRKQAKISRDDVLGVITDAIEMARTMSDPATMIRGADSLAKVLGYNAPEVKKLEIQGNAKRKLDKYSTMSDEELLAIAEGDVIEAEFTEVKHPS